jgi:ABC-2 type transport system permease protein
VAGDVSVNWTQLKLIFLLRWQLTRNQWGRSKYGIGPVIAILIATAAGGVGALCFFGGLLGAAYGLRDASAEIVMQVWLIFTAGFLFLWLIGLIAELQRSETIDLQRLMHLPVVLGQVFFINYLASHLGFTIAVTIPAALGLSIGLVIARGPMMLLLLPLTLSMIFMITAWTYCLQGWLTGLMSNPRRRRSIIVGITFVFILIAQAPNIYFNVLGRAHSRNQNALPSDLNKIVSVQKFLPPFWVSLGAGAIAEERPGPALLGTIGCLSIGAIGLRRAYRNTVKFYSGATGGKAPAARVQPRDASTEKGTGTRGNQFIELRLPGVPDQASAVAAASFRSILRAPEVKMALGAAFVVPIILWASFLVRGKSLTIPENLKSFLAPGAMAFSFMMLVQFFSNQFGFDRDGFCAFVLSPADRRLILLGKNLAALPIICCSGLLLLVLVAVRLHLPALTILAGLFQIATMSIIVSLYGNLFSIYAPYRIQQGSLKPTQVSGSTRLAIFLGMMVFPFALSPVFLPALIELLWHVAGMPAAVPINLLFSIGLAALAALLYWQLLPSLGRLLQRRETKILEIVTAEVE